MARPINVQQPCALTPASNGSQATHSVTHNETRGDVFGRIIPPHSECISSKPTNAWTHSGKTTVVKTQSSNSKTKVSSTANHSKAGVSAWQNKAIGLVRGSGNSSEIMIH